MNTCAPAAGDALLVVDVQRDFLPGGALGVAGGDRVIKPLNRWIERFSERGLPVFATRDWHPPNHCSFRAQGGPWPVHCVADSAGAAFPEALRLPASVHIVSKAMTPEADAYSGFAGTELNRLLAERKVKRVFIGGLTTDYCVLQTTLDARRSGYGVVVLEDAIAAVDVQPGDGARAIEQMKQHGAVFSGMRADSP